jgi:hypothetical protein
MSATKDCAKISYPDAASAHAAAQIIRSGRHKGKRGRHARAYLCPTCGAYHLTSQPSAK